MSPKEVEGRREGNNVHSRESLSFIMKSTEFLPRSKCKFMQRIPISGTVIFLATVTTVAHQMTWLPQTIIMPHSLLHLSAQNCQPCLNHDMKCPWILVDDLMLMIKSTTSTTISFINALTLVHPDSLYRSGSCKKTMHRSNSGILT